MLTISTESKIDLLDFDELTAGEQILISRACKVRLNAQAPYSHYWVGCSVMTEPAGRFFDGCNVERNTWTQTTHAEQNAIDSMIAAFGPSRIKLVAVVGAPETQEIVWPPLTRIKAADSYSTDLKASGFCPSCGHCLQIIAENCFDANGLFDPAVPLLGYTLKNDKPIIYRTTIGDAYPMPFLPQHLGINYANDPKVKNHK